MSNFGARGNKGFINMSKSIHEINSAEKIFEELFVKNMRLKNFKGFKQDYRTLYNQVIIPAMLKFREDGNKRS